MSGHQLLGGDYGEGNADYHSNDAVNEYGDDVHGYDLQAAGSDQFHDADLLHLLGDQS